MSEAGYSRVCGDCVDFCKWMPGETKEYHVNSYITTCFDKADYVKEEMDWLGRRSEHGHQVPNQRGNLNRRKISLFAVHTVPYHSEHPFHVKPDGWVQKQGEEEEEEPLGEQGQDLQEYKQDLHYEEDLQEGSEEYYNEQDLEQLLEREQLKALREEEKQGSTEEELMGQDLEQLLEQEQQQQRQPRRSRRSVRLVQEAKGLREGPVESLDYLIKNRVRKRAEKLMPSKDYSSLLMGADH